NSIAGALDLKGTSRLRKAEVVDMILEAVSPAEASVEESPEAPVSEPERAPASGAKADGATSSADSGEGQQGNAASPSDETNPSGEGSEPAVYHAGDDQDRGRNRSQQNESGNRKKRRRRGRDRDREEAEWSGDPVQVGGHLDLRHEGYGFVRLKGFIPTKDDPYVSVKMVRQFGLRPGDHIAGNSRPASRNEKNPAMLEVAQVNGEAPEKSLNRPNFDELTPLFPDEVLRQHVKDDNYNMTSRIIDLVAPIGKGQRGLIVSPPKAGKTAVLKSIASSIEANNPEAELLVLLVDERPEEVTDMRRHLKSGEVIASTFDRPADEHILASEMAINRAKRLVESGKDVVILLDGITRLTRAYNMAAPSNGRVMSGGLDAGAIYPPKKFFGAARNVEEGGSLTILATALVETGSKMDEVIFEEFKGTGNMELKLDRRAAERRIYPAIDIEASSTRHEELLMDKKAVQQVWKLRRVLGAMSADGEGDSLAGLELLIDRLTVFSNNDEFLAEIAKGASLNL
ncbi:MAG: transcription termination factor Rho, partial [Acidimicrobiales bacterium]